MVARALQNRGLIPSSPLNVSMNVIPNMNVGGMGTPRTTPFSTFTTPRSYSALNVGGMSMGANNPGGRFSALTGMGANAPGGTQMTPQNTFAVGMEQGAKNVYAKPAFVRPTLQKPNVPPNQLGQNLLDLTIFHINENSNLEEKIISKGRLGPGQIIAIELKKGKLFKDEELKDYISKEYKKFKIKDDNYLLNYDWPGNVRELENTLERVVLIHDKPIIESDDIKYILDESSVSSQTISSTRPTSEPQVKIEKTIEETHSVEDQPQPAVPAIDTSSIKTLKELEYEAISAGLERTNWNMTTTAQQLGISRMTLYRKLDQHGLRKKD